ncbi:MAG: SpoIID/LytB domain-containing protein [Acidimicrobiales bacterium]
MQKRRWGAAARAAFTAALALFLATPPTPAGGSASTRVPVLVFDGRGFGHGVGLPQHGARWLATAARSAPDILATFYPGTSFSVAAGAVRVAVHTASSGRAVVGFPLGGEVRASAPTAGFPVSVPPGGQLQLSYTGGSYQVSPVVTAQSVARPVRFRATPEQSCLPPIIPCPTTTTTPSPPGGGDPCVAGCDPPAPPSDPPPPTTTSPEPPPGGPAPGGPDPAPNPPAQPPPGNSAASATSAAPVWAVPVNGGAVHVVARGRSYRGAVQAVSSGGSLRLVNELDVETYLRGLAEMPTTWPAAAIQAQVVAARTYALRAMAGAGEICDDTRCQVYMGVGREAATQNAAIDATRGVVVTYGGALASTVYSADAGGVTATPSEGFGTRDRSYPYLRAVPYETPDPLPWRVEVARTDVAARLGYGGQLTAATVTRTGPSGRAVEVALDGSGGRQVVTGLRFTSALGLRSSLFTIASGDAADPPPPPGPSLLQTPPDDIAALEAAVHSGGPASDARAVAAVRAGIRNVDVAPSFAERLADPRVWLAVVALGLVTAYALAAFGPVRPVFDGLVTDRPLSLGRPALIASPSNVRQ